MNVSVELWDGVSRFMRVGLSSRWGALRAWPDRALLLDEPLAFAEAQRSRLRQIYDKCTHHVWDGPSVFRESMATHGGIQLDVERRRALAHPMGLLLWGELAAWIVSAELAARLEDSDARMAASSQVFDEARHFYVLRDYMAALHVPAPPLDPFFAAGARVLLGSKDLALKLLTMQILVESAAQCVFHFLAESNVEPVLSQILPYIARDEARHVGLGMLHLPALLDHLTPAHRRRLVARATGIGDMLGLSQVRIAPHWRALGLDPRELIERVDQQLTHLQRKLGPVPGSHEFYFRADDPKAAGYANKLDLLLPLPEAERAGSHRVLRGLLDAGARLLAV